MKKLSRLLLSVIALTLAFAALPSREASAGPTLAWVPEDCCVYFNSPGTFQRLYILQNGQWVPTETTRCDPGPCGA
ncbi:MAG TPA: hypothetical protein VGX68_28075 [Thermoanaerobaculia bacterium]|jgi:hypothetical protein|nr:hypothetical protein [Thermoanaerobaculia bacterium]